MPRPALGDAPVAGPGDAQLGRHRQARPGRRRRGSQRARPRASAVPPARRRSPDHLQVPLGRCRAHALRHRVAAGLEREAQRTAERIDLAPHFGQLGAKPGMSARRSAASRSPSSSAGPAVRPALAAQAWPTVSPAPRGRRPVSRSQAPARATSRRLPAARRRRWAKRARMSRWFSAMTTRTCPPPRWKRPGPRPTRLRTPQADRQGAAAQRRVGGRAGQADRGRAVRRGEARPGQ